MERTVYPFKQGVIPVAVVSMAVFLASCAAEKPHEERGLDPTQVELSESAIGVSKSLDELSLMEQHKKGVTVNHQPPAMSLFGMSRLTSVNWSGPIEPLIKQLASLSQYRLNVYGSEPPMPILITLHEEATPVGQLLYQAGLQAHDRVEITIFPEQRVIEMHYASD